MAIYQIFLNAIIAPLIATIADRIAPRYRGSAASAYALGIGVGAGLGQVIGAQFIGDISFGFIVLGILTVIAAPAASYCFRELPSTAMPKKVFSRKWCLITLYSPAMTRATTIWRYLASSSSWSPNSRVQGYILYILTDYLMLEKSDAGHYISITATIIMIAGIAMAFVSGRSPISSGASNCQLCSPRSSSPLAFSCLILPRTQP